MEHLLAPEVPETTETQLSIHAALRPAKVEGRSAHSVYEPVIC